MDFVNKFFIFSEDVNSSWVHKQLNAKSLNFYEGLSKIELAMEEHLPPLFYINKYDFYIFNDMNKYMDYYSLFNNCYPKSKFLINFSKKTPLYKNKRILYFFQNNKKIKEIDSFLVRIPAEAFGVRNIFDVKNFSNNTSLFFETEGDFSKILSQLT